MNGLQFERYVANLLRAAGLTVYRSAASRGCADLVVSNDERQYLTVQCKKHGRVRYVRESGSGSETEVPQDQGKAGSRTEAAANDVPDPSTVMTYEAFLRRRASARASAPSVGSPSSGREDEEAS